MRIIWIFMIFSAFIAAASAITCYDCNSLSDPRCNQYFHAKGVKQTNCDEADMPQYLQIFENRVQARGCITKIHENNNKVDKNPFYIRRGCFFGFVDDTKEACNQKDILMPWADLIDCQVCTEDLCNTNSGQKNAISKIFLCLTIVLSIIANKVLKI